MECNLDHVVATDDLAVQHGSYAGPARAGNTEGIEHIALCIRTGFAHGALRTGDDDWLVEVAQHVIEQSRRIGQRVSTVGNDEAVIPVVVFPNHHRQFPALGRGDIGRVHTEGIVHKNAADLANLGQELEQFLPGQRRRQTTSAFPAGNRAAGCNE